MAVPGVDVDACKTGTRNPGDPDRAEQAMREHCEESMQFHLLAIKLGNAAEEASRE